MTRRRPRRFESSAPRRMRYSWEARCRLVALMLEGVSPAQAAVVCGASRATAYFTPLLALWAIWVGIGFSTRASGVRVAQQLAGLAGLPLLGVADCPNVDERVGAGISIVVHAAISYS
jgi:hypothetical protein